MNAYNHLQNELEQGILSEEPQTKQPQEVITTTTGAATETEAKPDTVTVTGLEMGMGRVNETETDMETVTETVTEAMKDNKKEIVAQLVFATEQNSVVPMEVHCAEGMPSGYALAPAPVPVPVPVSIPISIPTHLPSIGSIIIDIPSSAVSSSPSAASSSLSSSSSSSSSYDTDSSTASSTCCTRHGEHIYMERTVILQQQLQHQHQHQQQNQHHQHVARSASSSSSSSLPDVSSSTPAPFKSKSKHSYQKSWPIFILLISIVEISIFVYDQLTYKRRRMDLPTTLHIPTNSVFIYRPDRRLQIWRFVSYMFLHANWFHLGFNVVIQLFYGVPLEVMHGSMRVCIIYLAGVFAGSLGTSVVDSDVYLVGASGGVYALLAAHLANLMLNYAQMKYAVAQLVSVIIFVLCDLGYAFYTQYLDVIELNAAPPVSYIAHLTGALAGLTIGLLVLKNFEQRSYENIIWYLALGVYSAFTIFAIAFNLANTVTAQRMEEQGEVITQHLLHDLGVS